MSKTEPAAETTHFGYKNVPVDEKVDHVRGVFDSVATRYDIMNDLMSAGHAVLDLAGGTGDLALKFARQVGPQGHVVLADINAAMLEQGRQRLVDAGVAGNLSIAQVNAEELPFDDASFDRITIAFGLRNVTDKDAALASMYRVLKPGGKVLILEFSEPAKAVKPAYDLYSFKVLPLIGKIVARDEDSYQYLAESIRMHPDQETLLGMMKSAGFERCRYQNLAAGVVALHIGYKI
jgi:demethylmenaquinone methyltransferase/2-methoxy-6-polyprenyl-1,4-benzoquinol methylase